MLSLVRPSLTVEIVVVDAPRFGTRMPPARPVRGNVICWAIRGQPQVGLRRFISTTASINSWAGPFGPGRRLRLAENSI
jgi:hypothetical protein